MQHAHQQSGGRRDRKALEARRLRAGRLFAKGVSQAEVARRCGVTSAAASKWHTAWERDGLAGLRSKGAPGPDPRLSPAEKRRVAQALRKGPMAFGYTTDLWTLPRVATVIRKLTGVRYHPGHVWKVLRGMGWTSQKPERRAIERDEAAIRHWVAETWPRIRKRGLA